MKMVFRCALLSLFPLVAHGAQPWQEVIVPTVAEAAATFPNPPKQYGAINWAIWGGPQTKDKVIGEIDRIAANGGGVYMINNSQRVTPKYLSPEYMDIVKAAVAEAKKNGMYVWIETDCGYPDGFAGGAISKDYPLLGMQGIITDCHTTVAAGATLDIPLPPDTLGIMANAGGAAAGGGAGGTPLPVPADGLFKIQPPRGGGTTITIQLPNNVDLRFNVTPGEPFQFQVPAGGKVFQAGGGGGGGGARGGRGGGGGGGTVIPIPADGHLKWTAPAGNGTWDVAFVRRVYRSSPTRNDNGTDGGATKDGYYSLIDYLDPEATKTFIKIVNETYEKAVGDEFGKTVLGFRGDETDYSGVTPWTPKLLETFQKIKGYDLKPYVVQFVGGAGADTQRVRADYWDVWSQMFRDNFYKVEQDWCRARNMDYMVHLNHEETMMSLVNSEGSFYRDMRYVGVPGIDNLNQIRPGIVADFPKLAASAAHVFGHPQVWEEEGGDTSSADGKFVFDYQLVRGVNYMNIRGLTGAAGRAPNSSLLTGFYVSRAQHLMAIGRPAAQVALYHPSDSMWMGDREADTSTVKLVTQLMEAQIDFDHIDADSLSSVCTLDKDGLKNLSDQVYHAVVIPSITVIQKAMLERLRAFAAAGGKVVFVGRTPTTVYDKTFLHPEPGAPDLSFATIEPAGNLTPKVIAALPKPDVKLDSACAPVKYIHRALKDGDVYFFYNESTQTQTRTATLNGTGTVQVWDALTGKIGALAGAPQAQGSVAVPLSLGAHEGRFLVIGPPPGAAGGN